MVKTKKSKNKAYSVGIRPPAEVREMLRKAAEAAGRSLNKEAEARLVASFGGDSRDDALFAGWSAEDRERFRALGGVLGLLCARIALTFGSGEDHKPILSALRAAIVELFNGLGVSTTNAEHERFFAMQARQMLAEIRQAASIKNPIGEKALLAEFAKAWGVEGTEQ